MEYRKISELTTVVTGGTPSTSVGEYWNDGNIPWLQSGCCQNCEVDSTERYITQAGYDNSSARMMPKHTVMIALTGATAGKIGYLNFEACGNQSITGILPCEFLNQRFLFYYLISKRPQILVDCVGGAQAHISQGYVKNIKIPMYPLEKQVEVVNVLDGITSIIIARKLELQSFDELIKSRFVEMFGDPLFNTSGWEEIVLSAATIKIGSGATPKGGKESYQNEGISFIRSMNVHDGRFEYKDLAHITDVQAKQLNNVSVKEGDVFINITGASVARSCIVPKEILPARVNQHVAIIRCDKTKLNPIFANNMFLNERFKKLLLSIGELGGATRQAITKQQLEMLTIILPPLKLQNQFADFVNQVDKSKLLEWINLAKKSFDLLHERICIW